MTAPGVGTVTLAIDATSTQNATSQQFAFSIASVVCDNYTNQWLQVVEAGTFIPPYYTGRVVALPPGGNSLSVTQQAPPGYSQLTEVAGQIAQFTALEEFVPPSTGAYQPPASRATGAAQIVRILNTDWSPSVGVSAFPVGTYTFDIPFASGRGIGVFINVFDASQTGTANYSLNAFAAQPAGLNGASDVVLPMTTSGNMTHGSTAYLRVYPGIVTATNDQENDVIGPTPQLVLTVTVSGIRQWAAYTVLP